MRRAKSVPRLRLIVLAVLAVASFGVAQASATQTIGDLVWRDDNNNGKVDAGEPGVPGVVLKLYRDFNHDCVPDAAGFRTVVTNAFGSYLFLPEIGAGNYIVRIEPENFAPGGALEGYVSSDGFVTESNDVANDNRDHGVPANGGIEACGVDIQIGTEPVGESPTLGYPTLAQLNLLDADVQTTIDFGVHKPAPVPPVVPPVVVPPPVITGTPPPTLAITKRANRSTMRLGQLVTFRIQVRNTGRSTATGLVVCDRVPSRAAYVKATGARVAQGRVCFNVAKLDAGATAGFLITFRAVGIGTIKNVATAAASNAPGVTARASVRVTDVRGAVRIPGVTG